MGYFLLPGEYAQGMLECGGTWGTIGVQQVQSEGLYVVSGWTKADGDGRSKTSEWHRGHFSWHAPNVPGAGWWYRVEPELHDVGREVAARSAAIPAEEFRRHVRAGWRVVPAERAVPALAVSVDDDGRDRWSGWWLTQEGAQPNSVDVVRAEQDLLDALGDAWPLTDLRAMKVAVIGTGSIGSAACEQLVMYGVRELALVDPDHVRPHNIARMRLRPDGIGRRKVNAVADHLRARDANVNIVALPFDVIHQADHLRSLLPEMDAILVCTDGVEPRRVANHLAARAGVPAVFACVLENGALGEVYRVLPHRTGCLLCQRAELIEADGMDPEPSLDLGYGAGTRHLPMTAVGGDLSTWIRDQERHVASEAGRRMYS